MGFGFGGFLRQMSDTNKENRQLAKWATRKKDNRIRKYTGDDESLTLRSRQLSEEETMTMVRGIIDEQKRDRRRQLFVLGVSIVLGAMIMLILKDVAYSFLSRSK